MKEKFLKNKIMQIVFVFILVFPCSAYSTEPLDSLKGPVDQVIKLLQDPLYQDASQKDLQREKIRKILSEIFDFTEMAKRTLARNWKKFTLEQKKEFTHLFSKLLGNTYIGRMQGEYEDDKIVYQNQKKISNSKARIKTKILKRSINIPVVYSMLNQNGTWKIYDVNIEGVSLVKNYRTQFNKILMKKPPSLLIEQLKKKIELQEKKRSKKD
jgi:phospholipid transport system substrate-binding protein